MTPLDYYQWLYRKKLRAAGIPWKVADRSTDQQKAATLFFWAVNLEISHLSRVTQEGLEAV